MDHVLQIQNATEVAAWSQSHETHILAVAVPVVLGLCCCCCCISWRRVDETKAPWWVKCLVQRAPSCIPLGSCCCCCFVNRFLFECKGNGNCQGKGHAGPHLALKENQIPDTFICYNCMDNADGELGNNVKSDMEQQLLLGVD